VLKVADVLDLAKKLVSIPSPFGKELEIAEFLAKGLKGDVKLQPVDGFGPNVIATNGPRKKGPKILLAGHMDTVPAPADYGRDPYRPMVKDGKLFGLGACDMKAGLAVIATAYNEFADTDADLTFLGTSDEEGNCNGVFKFLADARDYDLALVAEPTNLRLMLGCRGRYVLEAEVIGKAAHGARPEKGANAIARAARAILALENIQPRSHDVLGPGSACILKIEGGGDGLSVPDRCVIRLDRHVVPGDARNTVMAEARKALEHIQGREDVKLRWMERPTPFLEPYIFDKRGHIGRFAKAAGDPEVIYGKSVGDYNALATRFPTAVFGPTGDHWHAVGEYVEVESIGKCLDAYRAYLRGLSEP
jgi:acetylornithine deacetylase/succinyl-diaminopimelate desuccinylase-like protein